MENFEEKCQLDEGNNLIESLKKVLPVIQQMLPMDSMFAITDREKFIFDLPGKRLNTKFNLGAPVTPEMGLYKCIQTGEKITRIIPKGAIHDFPIKSYVVPLKNSKGEIVGALSMGLSDETKYVLHTAAQTIASTAEEITATTEELAGTAINLSNGIERLKNSGASIIDEIKKTSDILEFVNDIAASSNLLGLNAAIEAARAGENGRGFTVVANEIRKMADNSAKSVKDISAILLNIQNGVYKMVEAMGEIAQMSERQAAATEEVSASMQQLASSANEVEKTAENI